MMDIMTELKPKIVKLADGKEYKLPPLDLTTLSNIEDTMGFPIDKLQVKMEEIGSVKAINLVVHALLKENHPDITLENAGRLVTMKHAKDIMDYIKSFAE